METAKNIIDVKGLTKRFNHLLAVDHIDLQVKNGQIFGFLGPNGSGKTTTIRMLCGLLTPDSGSGYCLGYDIVRQSEDIKRHVGYMSQRFTLYEDLSIYENMQFIATLYGLLNPKEKIEQALEGLGLAHRQGQLAGQLSGGWKQRLALACALLHDPRLLLLDEPTAGVDPKARREFWDHIHYLSSQGITALVSTHYMDEAERCNHLAYIMNGKILVRGTSEEMIAQSGLITWEVRGDSLALLAQNLQKENIGQIITYGDCLHISTLDESKLEYLEKKYPKFLWMKIDTTLEDFFISLVATETKAGAQQ